MNKVLMIILVLLVLLMIGCNENISNESNTSVAEDTHRIEKIRVGVMNDYSPYIVPDGEGVSGPYIEIISLVFDNLGYEYEIVPLPWTRLLNAVESGEVDMAFPLYDKPERRSKFYYIEEPIGFSQMVFVGRKDIDASFEGDYSSLSDFRIGVVQDYFYSLDFEEAVDNGIVQTEEAISTEKNIEKLLLGRVDIIPEDIAVLKEYILVNNIEVELDFYEYPITSDYNHIVFTRSKDNSELRRAIDYELRSLKEINSLYDIFSEYNMTYYGDLFKGLEKDNPPPLKYFHSGEPLKIGVLNDTEPYVYYQNTELTGFAIDLMTEALNRIGVNYEFVELPFSRMLEELKSGSLDIGVDLYLKPEREAYVYYPTKPFAGFPTVIFKMASLDFQFSGDLNELKPYTVGYVRDYYLGPLDEYKDSTEFEFVITDSPEQNMESLVNGRVELVIDIKSTGENLIDKMSLTGEIVPVEPAIYYDYTYVAFSKANNLSKLVAEYNYVIETMYEDGTIESLFNKYGLTYQAFED